MTYPVMNNNEAEEVKRLEKSLITLNDILRKHHDFIKRKYKVSALEMEIMQYVIQEGPQKMKDVASHFHIKLSTLTSVIDKAENARILRRVNSKEDRRVVFLDVTKKGKSIFQEYNKYLKEMADRMKGSLDEESFGMFVESMEAFTRLSYN
ncbi:MAG: MarR family transcriptional regulator [Bacteroidetes bacterium]|nr:MAG: MarR family transcriptional regulator [Bacteroidota bacterium]